MAQRVKNLSARQEARVQSLDWEDPLEKGMATLSVFLPGEFHGQRSLAGYSSWGHKESNTTEQLTLNNAFYARTAQSRERREMPYWFLHRDKTKGDMDFQLLVLL